MSYDVIGDVHGCQAELISLLGVLGYRDGAHPRRTAVFVGDLVDRGPDTVGVLELVMSMVERGHALCVRGNHEIKLARKLRQANAPAHDLRARVAAFIGRLPSRLVLDDGRLIVAHEPVPADDAALVVYGHTTVDDPLVSANRICVDTGCVYGGRLTALRYPERELVSVPAERMWSPRSHTDL